MDKDWLVNLLTGWGARLVMKLAMIAGGGTTAVTQDKATQIAAAAVTVIVFAIEQWQSHMAHQRALQTPPDPLKPIVGN